MTVQLLNAIGGGYVVRVVDEEGNVDQSDPVKTKAALKKEAKKHEGEVVDMTDRRPV